MTATVLNMADHRAVFVLPDHAGTVVFLASRGKPPRIAHEQHFRFVADASSFARELSTKLNCGLCGLTGPAFGRSADEQLPDD